MEKESDSWKERVYSNYISSGFVEEDSCMGGRVEEIEKIIQAHVTDDKKAKILDLGCGHGSYLKVLKDKGYENIFGVDISEEQINKAKSIGVQEVKMIEIKDYIKQEKSDHLDVVMMIDIIEHMEMGKIFKTLDEVHRTMKKGGTCILHVPNAQGLFGMRVRYGDLTHEHSFTPSSMRQLLSVAGFEDIKVFEDKPVVHGVSSFLRRLMWDILTVFPRLLLLAESPGAESLVLSQNMLVTARK